LRASEIKSPARSPAMHPEYSSASPAGKKFTGRFLPGRRLQIALR
jgi:hypothetical protein